MSLSYEAQRIQNIKDNEALLLSLGLITPSRTLPLKARPTLVKKPSNTSAKRQRITKFDNDLFTLGNETGQISDEDTTPNKKVRRTPKTPISDSVHNSGARRSLRSSARKSYVELKENDVTTASPSAHRGKAAAISVDDDDHEEGNRVKMRNNNPLGKRTEDPKQFGHIPGVEVGRWWATRMEASTDAVHAPFVAGISGNPAEGAWSVALSGGYADDVDLGTAFTYTGCGGRDLKGTKTAPKNLRTAPQTFDQSFDNSMNAALKRSAETRKPVRVIRGFKLPSPYAPAEGYRYDGLYVVEKAWMAKGLTKGLMVCRYAFKRMEGQGELPMRTETEGGE